MIQPFGIILIIYILKNTVMKRNIRYTDVFVFLLALLVILELFVNVGYMVKIGNYELLYDEFVLVLLLIVSIYAILKRAYRIRIKISLIFLLMTLIYTEILLAINPISEVIYRNGEYILPEISIYSILVFSKVVIMLIISVAALQIIDKAALEDINRRILKYVRFIYAICGIEWIMKNIFHSQTYHSVVNLIFGKGSNTVDILLERGGLYSLQGLLREPAHLSFGLFMFLLILIFSNLDTKIKNRYFFIGIVYLILGGSLSGIGYAVALILSYILHSRKKVKPIIFLFGLGIIFIFIIPNDSITYYSSRIINSLKILGDSGEAIMYTSEHVRLFSITETLKTVFFRRPVFGAGLGIPYAYSTNVMILSSIGVIGFIAWFWYYFISIGKVLKDKNMPIIILMFAVLTFIGSIKMIYSAFVLLLVLQMKYFSKESD